MPSRFRKYASSLVALGAILSCSLPSIGAGQSTETPTAPEPAATPLTSATAGPQSVSLSEPAAGTMMRWLDGSELVFVPAGVFSMGDDSPDAPRHSVSLSGFWIQRTEVTNRQYALCVQLGSCLVPKEIHSVVGLSDASLRDYPVTNLSWTQAQAYCEWMTGGLPTEAEWEKAARGQHGSTYPWGEADPQPALLNFADAAGAPQRVTAHIAGRSPYGALDMAGNVFEWVQDWYGEGYYLDSPSADPPGPGDGVLRSVRSSAFSSGQGVVRAASRSFAPPEAFRSDLGFRCVVRQPAPIASLCRSSGFIVGDAAPTGGSCSPAVTSSAFSCAAGDGLGTVDIGGGTVTSVEVVDPEDRTSTCDIYRGRRLACRVKDPGAAIQVRYCVTCAGEESTSAPPEIVCPAGTAAGGDPARRGECIATDPTAARVCSEGMVPDAASPRSCIPNPCPAGEVPDPRDPSACIANACPAGSSFLDGRCLSAFVPCIDGTRIEADSGRCVPDAGSLLPTMLCPEGTYYDPGLMLCVSGSGTYAPGAECLSGMTYDVAGQCCQVTTDAASATCAPDEARKLIDLGEGVMPALVCASAGATGERCDTVTVRTGVCPKPDVPEVCNGLGKKACLAIPGCKWDNLTKICS